MLPRGFLYLPDFISHAEERTLLVALNQEPFAPMRVRGQITKRETVSYGLEFKPYVASLPPAPPLPAYLRKLRRRVAGVTGFPARTFVQSILSRYPDGSNIGWHVDHASFGAVVACVSILGSATLSLRGRGAHERVALAPRSLYVLSDDARVGFEHKVVAHALRYSITLRVLATVP
jgi:alkylated DNA repair dioxygenase AlkB